jgi:hypothetical protein
MLRYNTRCFKKSFTTLKAYINLIRGHYCVLNCHDEAKHTKFYLGQLRLNATSTGNAGCLKKESFTMIFQLLLGALGVNAFVTLATQ